MRKRIGLTLARLLFIPILTMIAGCQSLPSTGPSAMDISLDETKAASRSDAFTMIDLDQTNVRNLGAGAASPLTGFIGGSRSHHTAHPIGLGDKLAITVWEASSDGLFSSTDVKQTKIDATVDRNGAIFVPYAGRIPVTGQSIEDVRTTIAEKLQGQAIDPQVQVALAETAGAILSVVGDVVAPGQFSISSRGLRLIEAIALAGGPSHASYETDVTVARANTRASVRLAQIMRDGQSNIYLRSGDIVQLLHRPRSFTAFGAVTAQNIQSFQAEDVSLAEAIAQSGGLNDSLADAGGVFLFRFEKADRLASAGIALPADANAMAVPTIYRLDFTAPEAFFTATSFMMRDKDIIYVANAPATEFQKFVGTVLSPLIGSTQSVASLQR